MAYQVFEGYLIPKLAYNHNYKFSVPLRFLFVHNFLFVHSFKYSYLILTIFK